MQRSDVNQGSAGSEELELAMSRHLFDSLARSLVQLATSEQARKKGDNACRNQGDALSAAAGGRWRCGESTPMQMKLNGRMRHMQKEKWMKHARMQLQQLSPWASLRAEKRKENGTDHSCRAVQESWSERASHVDQRDARHLRGHALQLAPLRDVRGPAAGVDRFADDLRVAPVGQPPL